MKVNLFTRRQVVFIASGAALITTGGVYSSSVFCNLKSREISQIVDRIYFAMSEVNQPERLAKWCQQQSKSYISAMLERKLKNINACAEIDCVATQQSFFRQTFREDFQSGHFVVADRIVVSETECLAALLCNSQTNIARRA